tara:strand:+ start:483 stop:866 length:384 start_codon:yes stop_codon:yes gene_type:complete
MKKILIIILLTLFSSSIFAEYVMQPINCTTKKTSNCGAYIYNTKTGEVYICDSSECKEIKTPIEVLIEYEDEDSESSIIPKKKKSKIPKKPKKKESKIPKKPKKEESKDKKCKDTKIPKPGCTKKTN